MLELVGNGQKSSAYFYYNTTLFSSRYGFDGLPLEEKLLRGRSR